MRQIFASREAAGKGSEPQTDIRNKGFLIKVSFKMLTGTKSALPQTRHTFLVPARDRRDGGAGGVTSYARSNPV